MFRNSVDFLDVYHFLILMRCAMLLFNFTAMPPIISSCLIVNVRTDDDQFRQFNRRLFSYFFPQTWFVCFHFECGCISVYSLSGYTMTSLASVQYYLFTFSFFLFLLPTNVKVNL